MQKVKNHLLAARPDRKAHVALPIVGRAAMTGLKSFCGELQRTSQREQQY
jgi:hypothetical protein